MVVTERNTSEDSELYYKSENWKTFETMARMKHSFIRPVDKWEINCKTLGRQIEVNRWCFGALVLSWQLVDHCDVRCFSLGNPVAIIHFQGFQGVIRSLVLNDTVKYSCIWCEIVAFYDFLYIWHSLVN